VLKPNMGVAPFCIFVQLFKSFELFLLEARLNSFACIGSFFVFGADLRGPEKDSSFGRFRTH
jgi:hypothetical protein